MATAPTRVLGVTPALGWTDGTTTKTSPTFNVNNGDLIVLLAFSEDSVDTLGAPTWTGTGTWTLRQSIVVSSYATAYLYTCAVTATASGVAITQSRTGSTNTWSFYASVWRSHGGLGNTGKANAAGAPSLAVTTSANSAIVFGSSDWNAVSPTGHTYRTVNGSASTESSQGGVAGGTYETYTAYSLDTGTAGTTTVGLTAPSGQKYSIVAAEVLGTAGATKQGSAAGTVAFAGAAAGSRHAQGAATGTVTFTGAATGTALHKGSAAGPITFTGSAAGQSVHKGAGTGAVTFTGSASGSTARKGSATGSVTFAGAGAGRRQPQGHAAGTVTYTGAGSGVAPTVGGKYGSATGTVTFTGTGAGQRTAKGSAAGTVHYIGTAAGVAPVVGAHQGAAAGALTITGLATGITAMSGQASGTLSLTGYGYGRNAAAVDITVTATLGPRTRAGSIDPRTHDGSLDSRRWAAHQ